MRRTAIHRLVVAVAMTATLGGLAAPAQAAPRPTKATAAALVRGEVFTQAAAAHRARKMFALVRVPTRAVLRQGVAAPGNPTPDSLDADLYTAIVGHWWLTPDSAAAIAKWVVKHPPIGFVVYGSGTDGGRKTLLFKPISHAAGCCTTIDVTVSHVGKGTGISIAAFVQWQPRRVPAERVPATTTTALLEVGSDTTQTMPSFPNTSVQVSGDALLPLVTTLNQLTATREEPLPCPYTPNWSKATFRYGDHVVLFASPSACPYVEVTVNGNPSQTLSGNITDLVAQILGVTAVPHAM
ncbi:hypothetical protein acdb102_19280 [Acidothermaceae bacterium B102]|nr:hypothetical protein acdb102_19280 [Acidothermaceae bacterium B102]